MTVSVEEGHHELARRLGHDFADPQLLEQAVTHRSATALLGVPTYERLEFLGDAVLGLIVSDMIHDAFPDADEGEMSRRRARLVRGETCAQVARQVGLGAYLRLDSGQARSGGRDRDTILAQACEAVIGALYRDGGLQAARSFVEKHWRALMLEAQTRLKDPKSALQEWAHACGLDAPVYSEIGRTGPDHAPCFTIAANIPGLTPAEATGSSKRLAEQSAAEAMLVREGVWGEDEKP